MLVAHFYFQIGHFFSYFRSDIFSQNRIKDAILSRNVPDINGGRVLSIKFMLNLCVSVTVLTICSFILQNRYEIIRLFL